MHPTVIIIQFTPELRNPLGFRYRRSRGKMEPELITVAGEAASQGGCVLCTSPDFLRGGFGDRTMIICDQCEREFHIGCLAEHGRARLTELPDGEPQPPCRTLCGRCQAPGASASSGCAAFRVLGLTRQSSLQ